MQSYHDDIMYASQAEALGAFHETKIRNKKNLFKNSLLLSEYDIPIILTNLWRCFSFFLKYLVWKQCKLAFNLISINALY